MLSTLESAWKINPVARSKAVVISLCISLKTVVLHDAACRHSIKELDSPGILNREVVTAKSHGL
jgi:hypothetical protein